MEPNISTGHTSKVKGLATENTKEVSKSGFEEGCMNKKPTLFGWLVNALRVELWTQRLDILKSGEL